MTHDKTKIKLLKVEEEGKLVCNLRTEETSWHQGKLLPFQQTDKEHSLITIPDLATQLGKLILLSDTTRRGKSTEKPKISGQGKHSLLPPGLSLHFSAKRF